LLHEIRRDPHYADQIEHIEEIAARSGTFASPAKPLPAELAGLLGRCGIEQLYCHQAASLDLVVVTGTASGAEKKPSFQEEC
jgi:ATP-dependent helicase YprA (DUF1998 family)